MHTVLEWLPAVLGVVGGLVVIWVALIAMLLWQARRAGSQLDVRSMLRLAPDVVRLLKRLATSPAVPVPSRLVLAGLLVYLVLPIDLVPDFIPVIGYADDAIVVALAVRFAIRKAGLATVEDLWPGTSDGLEAVLVLCRVRRP